MDASILNGSNSPKEIAQRGVTIEFLYEFCTHFDLWNVAIGDVRRRYVIPMTSETRCRFVELPGMKEVNVVGKAATFVSYSNSSSFGNLVTALCDGSDKSRRVWIDMFSIRQWLSKEGDAFFEPSNIIPLCPSYLIAYSPNRADGLKNRNPFSRIWCLYELFCAVRAGCAIIFKIGEMGKTPDEFKPCDDEAELFPDSIDVEKADAVSAIHLDLILKKIRSYEGGSNSFNEIIRGLQKSAIVALKYPEVSSAACGDYGGLQRVRSTPSAYIFIVASAGYIVLLKSLLEKEPKLLHSTDDKGRTLLMASCIFGQLSCVKYLIAEGIDLEAKDNTGETALLAAVRENHLSCVQHLISMGAKFIFRYGSHPIAEVKMILLMVSTSFSLVYYSL